MTSESQVKPYLVHSTHKRELFPACSEYILKTLEDAASLFSEPHESHLEISSLEVVLAETGRRNKHIQTHKHTAVKFA